MPNTGTLPYNKLILEDLAYTDFYAEHLHKAVVTFPKFTRNYSKNYKTV
jgi:hypothetical protein